MKKICLGVMTLGLVWAGAVSAGNAVPSKSTAGTAKGLSKTAMAQLKAREPKFIVYYFFGNIRDTKGLRIEGFARDAVTNGYRKEIASGMLQWQEVNPDLQENVHFVKDFQLFAQSLVIVEMEKGKVKRYKNMVRIWEYIDHREAFIQYVCDEINAFMKGK